MLVLGIDDAGRGPVIGPMVLAGVLIDESKFNELKKLGVKDSKVVTEKRREMLVLKVKELAESFEVIRIPPTVIDGKSGESRVKLNELEAKAMAEIINRINKGFSKIKVIIDCPSAGIESWTNYLKTRIKNLSNLEIICEHKADKNYVAVSAASLLAKSVREKEMDKLKKKYGDQIGSGYTSDPTTQKFLEKNAIKLENDGIFRKTWITWKNASQKLIQRKLV